MLQGMDTLVSACAQKFRALLAMLGMVHGEIILAAQVDAE
jgi:hypothetical protein